MADDVNSRAAKIVARLKKEYPDAGCSLSYKTAHQLLVATILSAQTADEQVNKITPGLFRRYRTIEDFAGADIAELEEAIKSMGLYRNKAKAIKTSAVQLLHEFGGVMPDALNDMLVSLEDSRQKIRGYTHNLEQMVHLRTRAFGWWALTWTRRRWRA